MFCTISSTEWIAILSISLDCHLVLKIVCLFLFPSILYNKNKINEKEEEVQKPVHKRFFV